MQQVPSSNLLLLVTDRTCDCSIFPPVLREAKEVKYILRGASLGAGGGLEGWTGRGGGPSLRGSDLERRGQPPSPPTPCPSQALRADL